MCVCVMTLLTLFILLTLFSALCFDIKKVDIPEDSYTKCTNNCIDLEIGLDVCVCLCMCVCM